ncbi:MAG: hypothetical protein RBT03_01835 [Kiritimatiellia bacterium]|nr:hypothetical protein [Kiritimatiellia bacterium]
MRRLPTAGRVGTSGGAVAEAGAVPSGATRREGAEAMARGGSAGIAYPERRACPPMAGSGARISVAAHLPAGGGKRRA